MSVGAAVVQISGHLGGGEGGGGLSFVPCWVTQPGPSMPQHRDLDGSASSCPAWGVGGARACWGGTHNLCFAAGAAAVGGGEGGGAGFAVAGPPATGKGTAHRQGVDAVGVPIAVAVVIIDATVAGGPDEDGAEPPTPLGQGEDEQEMASSPSSSVLENPEHPCCDGTSKPLLRSGASKLTGRKPTGHRMLCLLL